MLKFVVRSGGNHSTEEQRVNVKKDIVVPIIDDILCNIVKRNTAIKAASTKTGQNTTATGRRRVLGNLFTNEKQMCRAHSLSAGFRAEPRNLGLPRNLSRGINRGIRLFAAEYRGI